MFFQRARQKHTNSQTIITYVINYMVRAYCMKLTMFSVVRTFVFDYLIIPSGEMMRPGLHVIRESSENNEFNKRAAS